MGVQVFMSNGESYFSPAALKVGEFLKRVEEANENGLDLVTFPDERVAVNIKHIISIETLCELFLCVFVLI